MVELKEHNVEPCNNCIKALQEKNSLCYISGVGTGKTYVTMSVIERMFKDDKVLYVVPKYSIANNAYVTATELLSVENIEFICYNQFKDLKKTIQILNKYSLVVFDECHHLGSDIFGQNVLEWLRINKKVKVLGLTATPLREDKVDVSEYFDNTVYGLSVFEAIKKGLMAPIDYRVCFVNKKEYKQFGNPKSIFKIDYNKSVSLLTNLVTTHKRDKWICYFNSVKQLNKYLETVKLVFGDEYEFLVLHSNLRNVDKILDKARSCPKCVILSCNILLEGVHVKGITGIVLFRNVTSVPTLQQIIGRTCSIGNTVEPFIVDTTTCAKKLLSRLLEHDTVYLKKDGNEEDYRDLKTVIKVGLNDETNYDVDELLRIIRGAPSFFCFRGKVYGSVFSACKEFNIPVPLFNVVKKKYKLTTEQTLTLLIKNQGGLL